VTGKSRAFVNDMPVNLDTLTGLGIKLIDIHSQHQSLNLSSNAFQLKVLDIFAGNDDILPGYRSCYRELMNIHQKIITLAEESEKSRSDLDYFRFQFNQMEEAHLQRGEKEELEQEIDKLSHAEEIKANLATAEELMEGGDISVLTMLRDLISNISVTAKFINEAEALKLRVESAYIELRDLSREIAILNEKIYTDPERLGAARERLDIIYSLEKKHRVSGVDSLLELQESLHRKIIDIDNYDSELADLHKERDLIYGKVEELAAALTLRRKEVIPSFEDRITNMLREMAMPGANFRIMLDNNGNLTNDGRDRIQFLFSANRNAIPQDISKVASGGELSRLMLAIKSLMSDSTGLPTVVFDEIDTGVSGEVAGKVGNIIRRMSSSMQIINITHLPQIASKGDQHFLVFKNDEGSVPVTMIKLLTDDERHYEIARMLSGEEITGAAMENAKILLSSK